MQPRKFYSYPPFTPVGWLACGASALAGSGAALVIHDVSALSALVGAAVGALVFAAVAGWFGW